MGKWVSVYGGYRGEPWCPPSLHGQPPPCLLLSLDLQAAQASLGRNPTFVPLSDFSGAAGVSPTPFLGGKAGDKCLEKQRLNFVSFTDQEKQRELGEDCLGLMYYIRPRLWASSEKTRYPQVWFPDAVSCPHSVVVRWEFHAHARTSFCSWVLWKPGSSLCYSQEHSSQWIRPSRIPSCLTPRPAQKAL